jgi:hypothetical protein
MLSIPEQRHPKQTSVLQSQPSTRQASRRSASAPTVEARRHIPAANPLLLRLSFPSPSAGHRPTRLRHPPHQPSVPAAAEAQNRQHGIRLSTLSRTVLKAPEPSHRACPLPRRLRRQARFARPEESPSVHHERKTHPANTRTQKLTVAQFCLHEHCLQPLYDAA